MYGAGGTGRGYHNTFARLFHSSGDRRTGAGFRKHETRSTNKARPRSRRIREALMDDAVLRRSIVSLLEGGNAHVTMKDALEGIDLESSTVRPEGIGHSAWDLLEHIRLAQEDILRYTLDPGWKSPEWPEGYWPGPSPKMTKKIWNNSVSQFFSDLSELVGIARDHSIDLTSEIPHGEGRTYLRELLLAADHTAYHLGQIVAVRKALGYWPS